MLQRALSTKPFDMNMLVRRESVDGNVYKWQHHTTHFTNDIDICYHEVIRDILPGEEPYYTQILFFDIDYVTHEELDSCDLQIEMDSILFELLAVLGNENICVYQSSTPIKISMHILVPHMCCTNQLIMKYIASKIAKRMPTYGKYIDLSYQRNKNLRIKGQSKPGKSAVKKLYSSSGPIYVLQYLYDECIPEDVTIYTGADLPKSSKLNEVVLDSGDMVYIMKALAAYINVDNIAIVSSKADEKNYYYVLEYIDIDKSEDCPLCARRHDKNRSLYLHKYGDHVSLKCYRERDPSMPRLLRLPSRNMICSTCTDYF